MANELHFEVRGKFKQNGSEKEFANVYKAKNKRDAERKAQESYKTFVKSGQTGPASSFGKLTVTSVEEFDMS